MDKSKLLEDCLDVKNQYVVSLERLASLLNVPPLTDEDKERIVEQRKFPQFD